MKVKTMTKHWTERSITDYLFRIATDFIAQLESKMESLPISQDKLAKRLGITKGAVSQWINHPGNVTLRKMIEYARALGMKVSTIAYEDGDLENEKGPINSEVFKICWEQLGKPRDLWDIQEIANTYPTATTYVSVLPDVWITAGAVNVPIKIYDSKVLLQGWEISTTGFVTLPTLIPINNSAVNEHEVEYKKAS
jgi:transcriptional regulator with XRE-family HTH domain